MRVTLPAVDYWKLRALMFAAENVQLESKIRVAQANANVATVFDALAKTHGLDASVTYRWDDATCDLIAE